MRHRMRIKYLFSQREYKTESHPASSNLFHVPDDLSECLDLLLLLTTDVMDEANPDS